MKRTPINPESDRQKLRRAERRQLASPFEHERCWVGTPVCTGWAEAWHELVGRAQLGSTVDPRNLCAACLRCNSYIEDNPTEARARGWKVPRHRAMEGVDGLVPAEPSPYALSERWT